MKRVIGLPGDTDRGARRPVVILNGTAGAAPAASPTIVLPISPNSPCRAEARQPDPARASRRPRTATQNCVYPRFRETLPGGRSYDVLDQVPTAGGDNFGRITVPAGHLFVMGDNRDNSDGQPLPAPRLRGVGLLPIDNLLGRALIGFWSTDGSAEWLHALDLVHRRALEPDLRDLLMADARGLARGDARPPAGRPRPVRAGADPFQPAARTIMSGSNSSATACSASPSPTGSTASSPTSPRANCRAG